MRLSFAILLLAASMTAHALKDFDRQQIEERIKPIGQVRVEGKSKAAESAQAAPAEPSATTERTGQAIYEQYCSVCHRDGVAGAPKFQQTADWQTRLDQKKLDGLVASAIKGVNAMPAKGACQDCSEADIRNAIQYMLPKK